MKKLTLLLFSVLAVQSCNYSVTKNTPETNGPQLLVSEETVISYELVSANVTAVCMNCHMSGGAQPELTGKQDLVSNRSSVLSAIISDAMPLDNPPLTACQKAILQKWFDLGGPDQSEVTVASLEECQVIEATPEPSPSPSPTPTPVVGTAITYELIKKDITGVCLRCHGNFKSRESHIKNSKSIMNSILANRMPKGAPPLTDCQKATLQKWFDLGAPETSTETRESLLECKES